MGNKLSVALEAAHAGDTTESERAALRDGVVEAANALASVLYHAGFEEMPAAPDLVAGILTTLGLTLDDLGSEGAPPDRYHGDTDDEGNLTLAAVRWLQLRGRTVQPNPHAPGGWTYVAPIGCLEKGRAVT